MNKNREKFVNSLMKAKISSSVADAILQRFDMLCSNFGEEEGYATAVAQYLPESLLQEAHASTAGTLRYLPTTKTSQEIEQNLKIANQQQIAVKPAKENIAAIKKRFNENIMKMKNGAVLIDSHGARIILDDDELRALQFQTAKSEARKTCQMESWASFKNGRHNLETLGE